MLVLVCLWSCLCVCRKGPGDEARSRPTAFGERLMRDENPKREGNPTHTT